MRVEVGVWLLDSKNVPQSLSLQVPLVFTFQLQSWPSQTLIIQVVYDFIQFNFHIRCWCICTQSRALSYLRRLGIRGQRRNSREFDLNSCESRPAIATATRDQRTRHNALLRPKHNWRSAVSDHTALRDAAAWIPHPSILQRLANRQLFLLDHSRRTQGWQPGSRHLRH